MERLAPLISLALLLVATSAGAAGAQTSPETHRPSSTSEAARVPGFDKSLEFVLGLIEHVGLVEDPDAERRIARIGYRVAAAAGDDELPYTFRLVDMDEPNAFALPGGFVFVTKGMWALDLTDDEMAHLLGHELAHARLGHGRKLARRAALMSIAEQLLVAGLIIGAPNRGSTVSYPQTTPGMSAESVLDQTQGPVLTGKAALVQGAVVFGQIFRELLQRGFTRGMEIEADAVGFDEAVRAGFAPEGGSSMLRKLSARVYDWPGAGWWRTHPPFDERITAALAREGAWHNAHPEGVDTSLVPETDDSGPRVQAQLQRLAAEQHRDAARHYLLECALLAAPTTPTAARLHVDLLADRADEIARQAPLLRDLRGLLDRYAEAIDSLAPVQGIEEELRLLREKRRELDAQLTDLHPQFLAQLDRPGLDRRILAQFLRNYPGDPRATEVRFRLAEQERLRGELAAALPRYLRLATDAAAGAWRGKARARLAQILPHLQSPALVQPLVEAPLGDELHRAAAARLADVITSFEDLAAGKDFLLHWPDTPETAQVRQRLLVLGRRAYNQGRQLEAIGDFQGALERYHQVLDALPDSEVVAEARRRIDHLRDEAGASPG